MAERTDENVSYEIVGEGTFEFFVDEGLFPKDVVMKALYPYLDTCYFFLRRTEGGLTVRCDLHDKGKDVGPAAMAGLMLWLDAISDTIHPDAEEPGPRGARHLPEPE